SSSRSLFLFLQKSFREIISSLSGDNALLETQPIAGVS
ncbi:hypothetical protein MTR67_038943, partial [Solanum verrucosum]